MIVADFKQCQLVEDTHSVIYIGTTLTSQMGRYMEAEERLLEARVSELEKQVRFLLHINGLDVSAMRSAPDKTLLSIYQGAVQLLGIDRKKLNPESIKLWAEYFMQFSEYEFVRLQNIIDYDHTWEPLYHLCVKMMTTIRQHKNLPHDVGLQHLYAYLNKGRRNLRDSAIIMAKKYPKNLPPHAKILLKNDDPVEFLQ